MYTQNLITKFAVAVSGILVSLDLFAQDAPADPAYIEWERIAQPTAVPTTPGVMLALLGLALLAYGTHRIWRHRNTSVRLLAIVAMTGGALLFIQGVPQLVGLANANGTSQVILDESPKALDLGHNAIKNGQPFAVRVTALRDGTGTVDQGQALTPECEVEDVLAPGGFCHAYVIDNNIPPVVSNVRTTGTTGDIVITYDLDDAESHLVTLLVEYRGGSVGSTWITATASVPPFIAPGDDLTVTWQSGIDEAGTFASDLEVRITPSDGQLGNPGVSSLFSIDNNIPPVVSNVRTTGTTGDIVITYDLDDAESHLVTLLVEYRGGSVGSTWITATASVPPFIAPGDDLTVTWQSGIDEAGTFASDLEVRITPSDGQLGNPGVSSLFSIDN